MQAFFHDLVFFIALLLYHFCLFLSIFQALGVVGERLLNTKKNLPAFALYKKLGFMETEMISMQKSPMLDKLKDEIEEQKAELKRLMAEKGELERMQEKLQKLGIDL